MNVFQDVEVPDGSATSQDVPAEDVEDLTEMNKSFKPSSIASNLLDTSQPFYNPGQNPGDQMIEADDTISDHGNTVQESTR